MTAEHTRLQNAKSGTEPWKKWGPYLSERAWGSVREDYSTDGSAWDFTPHDQARSKAYRWNEDGLAGWCDDGQNLCFALTLWNERDPILKERLFGLTGSQGKHGEDVKELLYFLDALPSHALNRALYKYPQAAFPYQQLLDGNAARTKADPEYELLDTGIFDENRYFDVEIEYIKAGPDDTLIQITAHNRGPDTAALHLLPTLWFRNTWAWKGIAKPEITLAPDQQSPTFKATKDGFGTYYLLCEGTPETLFCNNETNAQRLYGSPNPAAYVKDGIGRTIINGEKNAVSSRQMGTKAAAHYTFSVEGGQSVRIRLRLCAEEHMTAPFGDDFDSICQQRKSEADEFFATLAPENLDADQKLVQRQALAGLLWCKQFYNFNVLKWLTGDPAVSIKPPEERWKGRDHNWTHLNVSTVMSMPDIWEYPWFAAWDLAFHCVTFAIIDADFAKDQLTLLLREWLMHPSGQVPAYEWAFGDVNPPVHAWAALRVYRIEKKRTGVGDTDFLESTFHKLLLNFTWWVNRKDAQDRNVFQGGFLGLDNIGIFDRSAPLPGGAILDQADGTAWMAMYCLNMLAMALELAAEDATYEGLATKFLEHFFYISHAMNERFTVLREPGIDLWDELDGFYYDVLQVPGQEPQFLRARSMVGLLPLLAVETLEDDLLEKLPGFRSRMEWFLEHRPDLTKNAASLHQKGQSSRRLFAVVDEVRLRRILDKMLAPNEFLSDHGLRSVSKFHQDNPVSLQLDGQIRTLDYEPGESTNYLFGGNSNWRGPIWFPVNYLLIEALQKFDFFYGEAFQVPSPDQPGQMITLWDVATILSRRLIHVFTRDANGLRPVWGDSQKLQTDPNFCDNLLFFEYFHGETGKGLGASHQTGWTALVAKLIQQSGEQQEQ